MMFYLFLVFTIICESQSLNPSDNCEGSSYQGNWTCVKDEDGTFDVTLDCKRNAYGEIGLWLWSNKFPFKMKTLLIENCERLYLDLSNNPDHNLVHFSRLQVSNIKTVALFHFHKNESREEPSTVTNSPNESDSLLDYNFEDSAYENLTEYENLMGYSTVTPSALGKKFLHTRPDFLFDLKLMEAFENISATPISAERPGRLPLEATFKNIEKFRVETLWNVKPSGLNLGSLKIINVTVENLPTDFVTDKMGLNELLINSSVILKADKYPITIDNKEAEIKLMNTKMDFRLSNFLQCQVAKLIITGNTFPELSPVAFECEADEFIFSDNKVESLVTSRGILPSYYSFTIESPIVNIQRNIFATMASNAFHGITAPFYNRTAYNRQFRRVFNFSQNEIHVILPRTFATNLKETSTAYDSYNISDNSIRCSCHNTPWLRSLLRSKDEQHHQYSFMSWINTKHPNKCLDIANCTLNQVLYNLDDLCGHDYQCPRNVSSNADVNPTSNLMQMEYYKSEILKSEQKIADALDKISKMETEAREERNRLNISIEKILKMETEDREQQKGLESSIEKVLTMRTEDREEQKRFNLTIQKILETETEDREEQNRLNLSMAKVTKYQVIIVSLSVILFLFFNLSLIIGCFIVFKRDIYFNFSFLQRRLRRGGPETEMNSQINLVPD